MNDMQGLIEKIAYRSPTPLFGSRSNSVEPPCVSLSAVSMSEIDVPVSIN